MKISKPVKIIIGLLTGWVLISPFLFMVSWFGFVFSMAIQANQNQPNAFPLLFIPVFFLLFFSTFLTVGLVAFYLVHVLLNKTAGDVLRVVLGLGIVFFSFIGMPVYYFIYILPDNPPQWALAQNA